MFGELKSQVAGACLLVACGARSELDVPVDASFDASADVDVLPDVVHVPCTPSVLVDHVTARSLWLDGDYVYFASQSRGIGRVPKSGGQITTYSTDPTSYNVTTDASYVYWTAACCVARAPKSGKGGTVLTGSNLDLGALVVDGTNVYFIDKTSALWAVPKAGGSATQLASLGMGPMGLVLVDGSLFATLFWPPGGVVRVALDGTGLTSIASADGSDQLVADATSLYWIAQDRVLESPLDGSALIVHGAGGFPADIAVDDTKVHWTDVYGKIFTAPKGSTVSTSVNVGGILRNIAVDDQCVYYATNCCGFTDGQIMQRPK